MDSTSASYKKTTDKIQPPVELRRSKRISVKPSTFNSILKPKKSLISKQGRKKLIKTEKITVNLQDNTTTIERNADNTVEFFAIKRLLAHHDHIRALIASTQERRTNEALIFSDLFTHMRLKHDLVRDQLTIQQDNHEQQRETAEGLNLELRMLRDRIKNERGENIEIEGNQVSFIQINEE